LKNISNSNATNLAFQTAYSVNMCQLKIQLSSNLTVCKNTSSTTSSAVDWKDAGIGSARSNDVAPPLTGAHASIEGFVA